MPDSLSKNSPTKNELKNKLRSLALLARKEIQDKANLSKQICSALLKHPLINNSQNILCYLAIEEEVNLDSLISELILKNKNIYSPLCFENKILPAKISSLKNLTPKKFGIREPELSEEDVFLIKNNAPSLDLILVPGVAFDLRGNRIGHGFGYYDRFLSLNKAIRIGVCFSKQIYRDVPVESFDQKMDYLATEEGLVSAAVATS